MIEVSSFQAAEVTVSPPVGILTLLAPDHLDWHGTYDRYVSDKLNLFAHRSDLDLAVNARCPEAVNATTAFASDARRHLYGSEGTVRVAGDGISIDGEEIPAVESLSGASLRGRHNLDNLCGAITASRLLTGLWPDFDSLAAAVSSMAALPSRLETVARFAGVEFVNDTLASNPAGTIAALEAFSGSRVALIAGGHDRNTDLRSLAKALDRFGDVTLIFLGPAGERLSSDLAAIASTVGRVKAGNVSEAVNLAVGAVEGHGAGGAGDRVVLFSPAAPTPPVEGTYVERSAEFRNAVRHHIDVRGNGDSAAC